MRILGFATHWKKLDNMTFTTFRQPRKDTDWQVDELVQVVITPRSKNRQPLGIARIKSLESRLLDSVTPQEAVADGFPTGLTEMFFWIGKAHPHTDLTKPFNKLTLQWIAYRGKL